ncbi:MAG: hypothetical protein H9802_03775 [Candidatus Phocaeicola faecipullorum]|nr:hypothetical protein [Candidatus Phocaeicola faecipullorum]
MKNFRKNMQKQGLKTRHNRTLCMTVIYSLPSLQKQNDTLQSDYSLTELQQASIETLSLTELDIKATDKEIHDYEKNLQKIMDAAAKSAADGNNGIGAEH